ITHPVAMKDLTNKVPYATFLPPGVPASILTMPPATVCNPANAIHLKNFYDDRFNPEAQFDVITFCDGGDSDAKGLGNFDEAAEQRNPAQTMLAVDPNGDGKRNAGEPVLLQGWERFDDSGVDGIPDEKEPGYDATTNPDPAKDNFHWAYNPTGTEKN